MFMLGIPEPIETLSEEELQFHITNRFCWIAALQNSFGIVGNNTTLQQDHFTIQGYLADIKVLKSLLKQKAENV